MCHLNPSYINNGLWMWCIYNLPLLASYSKVSSIMFYDVIQRPSKAGYCVLIEDWVVSLTINFTRYEK